jgi:hypothetical protein
MGPYAYQFPREKTLLREAEPPRVKGCGFWKSFTEDGQACPSAVNEAHSQQQPQRSVCCLTGLVDVRSAHTTDPELSLRSPQSR